MSCSLDANVLVCAVDGSSPRHDNARNFLEAGTDDQNLLCVNWLTLMAFVRIATHPGIFSRPLTPAEAWSNVGSLLALPRTRTIGEETTFARDYAVVIEHSVVRGNLVPDAHLATILRQHGVRRIYTADVDFRRFDFLEVIDPFRPTKKR